VKQQYNFLFKNAFENVSLFFGQFFGNGNYSGNRQYFDNLFSYSQKALQTLPVSYGALRKQFLFLNSP
jgi:hypothetical protein